MKGAGIARTAREVFLTLGAVLGVVCLVVTVAGFALGVKPLIFRSGSMSPAIHTGDVAISRTVEASALERGDIVSVVNSGGNRVTHRLVNAARQGAARQLTLKGDANKKPDTEIYTVTKAERVLFSVPKAGYVVNAATSPAGIFVLGLYVAVLLLTVFRRGSPRGQGDPPARSGGSRRADRASRRGRSRAASRSVAIVAVGSTVMVATPAAAASWTDDVPLTGASYAAHTVLPPISSTCAASTPTVTIAWPERDPLYDYEVVLKRSDNSVASTKQVTGAAVSQTYTATGDFGFGALALGNFDFTVEIRSYLAASTPWQSSTVLVAAKKIRVSIVKVKVPVLGSVTCI